MDQLHKLTNAIRIQPVPLMLCCAVAVLAGFIALSTILGDFGTLTYKRAAVPEKERQDVREYTVQPGDTFAEIGATQRVPYEDIQKIIEASRDVYDWTTIRAGNVIRFVFAEEALAAVEYPLSDEMVVVVEKNTDSFAATTKPVEYDIEIANAKGTIEDSLFSTAASAGIEDATTLELADIFSGDIDFATDIREGDSFSVVYEKRSLDGTSAGTGKILAAIFTNGGTTYAAFRYKDALYDADGKSLTRQFLKSPLNYPRISSGFSYQRTNPVTKQVTPHRAIDYAASAGTPVIATANGTVSVAGSKGDLGITVELKHGSSLTQYAHLSSIAKGVKKGADVAQGEVIGYVGSTGISTGPHLQYAMFENGAPVNPLTVDSPRLEMVPSDEKGAFEKIRLEYLAKLQ